MHYHYEEEFILDREIKHSKQCSTDQGVFDITVYEMLHRVPDDPISGQYSFDELTGIYKFSSEDIGKLLRIYVRYLAEE